MTNNLLTDDLSVPVNGSTSAKVDINSGSGNLTIDQLADAETLLARGTLEYFEKQGQPTLSVSSENGEATLTLRGRDAWQPWFRLPWTACNGATEWQVHLNPTVSSDITGHTGGGNLKLNMAGMALSHLSADSGGGNVEVVLPDHAANLLAHRHEALVGAADRRAIPDKRSASVHEARRRLRHNVRAEAIPTPRVGDDHPAECGAIRKEVPRWGQAKESHDYV